MNKVITMMVLMAIVIVSLPLSTNAQRRTQVRQRVQVREAVGTDSYYEDDSVILRSKKVFVSSVDLLVGSAPEVPGGLLTAPGPDEEDVLLKKRILVATRTSAGNIYIGYLNPVVNGKQVILRRKKVSRKIIATLNCGNWTRELGGDYSFVQEAGPCIPGEEVTDTQRDVAPDGTVTEITTTSDGCKTVIEKIITRTTTLPGERIEICKPGTLDPTPLYETASGKLGKKFRVSEVVAHMPQEVASEIISRVPEKVNALIVYGEACPAQGAKRLIKVHYFTKGGGWNWVSFFVGVGVGFGIGWFIPKGKTNITGNKSQPNPLPSRRPIDGSGNTGGGLGTVQNRRVRRP